MNKSLLLTALLSYFVIVDPIGVSFIFAAITEGKENTYCRKMAFRSVLLSTIIVLFFGFWGGKLLMKLGISIESFRIAGGLLLFYTAFNMIMKPEGLPTDITSQQTEDISVFPLSFPLIAGPGCLTLTVLLFANARQREDELIALVVAVLLIFTLTFVCFLCANNLYRFMGKTGNSIVKRLLGVLLASLSIQFVVDGVVGLVH